MTEDKFLRKLEQRYPELQKKYFTKYLPVEGEIKENDWVLWNNSNSIEQVSRVGLDLFTFNTTHLSAYKENCQKVKLFLCSRDIQFGDELTWSLNESSNNTKFGDKWTYDFPAPLHKGWIKVIGEISPDATWVQEGAEIPEDFIEFWHKTPKEYGFVIDPKVNPDWQSWVTSVKIKGPCSHFH